MDRLSQYSVVHCCNFPAVICAPPKDERGDFLLYYFVPGKAMFVRPAVFLLKRRFCAAKIAEAKTLRTEFAGSFTVLIHWFVGNADVQTIGNSFCRFHHISMNADVITTDRIIIATLNNNLQASI